MIKKSKPITGVIFDGINYVFIAVITLICVIPMINVLAVSLSDSTSASAGEVGLIPVGFNLKAYEYTLQKHEILRGFAVTFGRLAVGVPLTLVIVIITAYVLSKETGEFKYRNLYSWIYFTTTLFTGGLIPYYMVIKMLGLTDNYLVLVLNGWLTFPVFYMIIMMNYFRQLPKALSESAYIDGAGHWRTLWTILVPLSKPALAVILLISTVAHWNSWFDGILFMSSPKKYPLQSYLQTVIVQKNSETLAHATKEELEILSQVSDRTIKAAQIFVTTLPVLIVYPFLQRYFIRGLVTGSVKG